MITVIMVSINRRVETMAVRTTGADRLAVLVMIVTMAGTAMVTATAQYNDIGNIGISSIDEKECRYNGHEPRLRE